MKTESTARGAINNSELSWVKTFDKIKEGLNSVTVRSNQFEQRNEKLHPFVNISFYS